MVVASLSFTGYSIWHLLTWSSTCRIQQNSLSGSCLRSMTSVWTRWKSRSVTILINRYLLSLWCLRLQMAKNLDYISLGNAVVLVEYMLHDSILPYVIKGVMECGNSIKQLRERQNFSTHGVELVSIPKQSIATYMECTLRPGPLLRGNLAQSFLHRGSVHQR